jgi:hypothetical protein
MPTAAPYHFTMPEEALSINAVYTDGAAPVTTVTPTELTGVDMPWLNAATEIELSATDADVTASGGSDGIVSKIEYSINNGTTYTYTCMNPPEGTAGPPVNPFVVSFTLGEIDPDLSEGVHTLRFKATDSHGNVEQTKVVQFGYDKTPPQPTLIVNSLSYNDLTAVQGFTRFYRSDVGFDIQAKDPASVGAQGVGPLATNFSDVKSREYMYSETFYADDSALDAVTSGWTTFTGIIYLPANWKGYIYARVTDNAGNISYARSAGIVHYTDSSISAGPSPATWTKTSPSDITATIALADNSVAAITDDKAGALTENTDYTLDASGNLALKASWLEKLDAGAHKISVSFNPLKVPYPADPQYLTGPSNEPPTPAVLNITINKAASTLSLGVTPLQSSGSAYGDNITFTATVTGTNGKDPDGKVIFYDGDDKIGEATLTGSIDAGVSTATFDTSDRPAGTHTFKAVYEGSSTYNASPADPASSVDNYNITKIKQGGVTVHEGADDPALTILDKVYGEAAFTLVAKGGDGTGAYKWTSSDTSKAAVNADTGAVTLINPGTCTISVQRAADGNYEASASASITLVVSPRPVSIKLTVADKAYDGKMDAAIVTGSADSGKNPRIEGLVQADASSVEVDLSGATASFADPNAGMGKMVTVTGLAIKGDLAGRYHLESGTVYTSATITRAKPAWKEGAPSASAISYGQSLSDATLTQGDASAPVALDVDGNYLKGSLAWKPDVDTSVIPGADAASGASGLSPEGYPYEVRFVPEGSDNYAALDGEVYVPVSPAAPHMAGGLAPAGSAIFSEDPADPSAGETLAASTITGDAVITLAGDETEVTGSWTWADDVDTTTKKYAAGYHEEYAVFTPDDPRVGELKIKAGFVAHYSKLEVKTNPTSSGAAFGSTLADAKFTAAGSVMGVTPGSSSADIDLAALGYGTWEWKAPNTQLTSRTGSQTALAVFKPDDAHKLDTLGKTGYAEVEVSVDVPVTPAAPAVDASAITAPSIDYGQTVADSGEPKDIGYVFKGVAGLDGAALVGTFEWKMPAAAPGAAGYDVSMDAGGTAHSVLSEGVYYAEAVFTPAESAHGKAYGPVTVIIKIEVKVSLTPLPPVTPPEPGIPDRTPQDELEDEVGYDSEEVLPIISAAEENYPAESFGRYIAALTAAQEALAEGAPYLPDEKARELLAELREAAAELEHEHPVISNSAEGEDGIITEAGVGVDIVIKGDFDSLKGLVFNGADLEIGPAGEGGARPLAAGGRQVGSVSKGSVQISLLADFVESLTNGGYEVAAIFDDGYRKGSGHAFFGVYAAGGTETTDISIIGAPKTAYEYIEGSSRNHVSLHAVAHPQKTIGGGTIEWSAEGAGTVTQDGLVTLNGKEGKVTITAKLASSPWITATATINVVKRVTIIRVPLAKLYLKNGTYQLPAVAYDEKAAVPAKLSYTSSNAKLIKVSAKGKLTVLKKVKKRAKVTVTIRSLNGKKRVVTVYVVPKAKSLTKVKAMYAPEAIKKGAVNRLRVSLTPSSATNVKVTYKSSKPSVLKVDKAGRLYALKKGKAKITVKAGKRSWTQIIRVK